MTPEVKKHLLQETEWAMLQLMTAGRIKIDSFNLQKEESFKDNSKGADISMPSVPPSVFLSLR